LRLKSFRICMLVGACALGGVALYYFVNYAVVLSIALGNSGVRPALQASIRAMWLAFAFQALLIGLLYTLVAFRPRAVSREVIVIFGLLQLVEAALLFMFSGSLWVALLLTAAAAFVLCGAFLWPAPPLPAVAVVPPAANTAPLR
jgi:hypothetical protein